MAVASTIKASFDSGGHSNISAVLRFVTRSQSVTIHIHARSESPAGCSSKLELPPIGTDHMVGVDGGQVGLLRCGFACMGGGGGGGGGA